MRVFISINILQLINYNVPKDVCKQGDLFLLDFEGDFYCFLKASEVHCKNYVFGTQKGCFYVLIAMLLQHNSYAFTFHCYLVDYQHIKAKWRFNTESPLHYLLTITCYEKN